ncbi:MAG: DNA polymerase IV [Erysipelotrichaceae bacterium]|nr:DNA polymerase IV [Erysipelotrichaceae bacterium]
MEKWILHIDINHCYAQIEEMKNPALKEIPMAVGGRESNRHGIILAKNLLAKKYRIKTGEPVRDALKKCPKLRIIHPDFTDYQYYTTKVKDIYHEYTDQVESYGLDEAWLDITGSLKLFGDPIDIARTIQTRIKNEIGLTVSVGISFNKIFAKMGSDMFKPYGLVHISKENYREIVWPLDIGDLFYVGHATKAKLNQVYITKIGQLARCSKDYIKSLLGKMGEVLWLFANGFDMSAVMLATSKSVVKSVGNGVTAIKDLTTLDELRSVLLVLCDSVASRLRDHQLKGFVVTLSLRDKQLHSFTRQKKREQATNLCQEIMATIDDLLARHRDENAAYRSVGVRVSDLIFDNRQCQLSLFEDPNAKVDMYKLETAIDSLRARYGYYSISRGLTRANSHLTDFNPKGDHTIAPKGYF